MYFSLDQAAAQGTMRTPFMRKIKGLLNFTPRADETTVFDFYETDTRIWDNLQLSDSTLKLGQSGNHRWEDSWNKYGVFWQRTFCVTRFHVVACSPAFH